MALDRGTLWHAARWGCQRTTESGLTSQSGHTNVPSDSSSGISGASSVMAAMIPGGSATCEAALNCRGTLLADLCAR